MRSSPWKRNRITISSVLVFTYWNMPSIRHTILKSINESNSSIFISAGFVPSILKQFPRFRSHNHTSCQLVTFVLYLKEIQRYWSFENYFFLCSVLVSATHGITFSSANPRLICSFVRGSNPWPPLAPPELGKSPSHNTPWTRYRQWWFLSWKTWQSRIFITISSLCITNADRYINIFY